MRAHMFGFVVVGLILMGGNCSRARVESMNEMNAGVELAQMKRFGEAAESLEKAAALDPTNHQAYYNLGIVQIELRSFSAAREALERAIVANPDTAGYHEKLGSVLIELNDWKGAQTALKKSLELDPTLFKAHFKLGRCSEELEDPQSALYQYSDAIMTGPRFLPSYSALGRLYADLRYPDQAAQVLAEALKVAMPGTEEEANIHHLLGTVYQQQRKYDEAITEFQSALGIVPGMSDALFSLGWTYALQGNDEEAKRYLDKYVMMAGADAPEHYVKAARDRLAELRTESP
ncbi:MAG: tetratricopeptide repeat protein [Deltaproteobacteria bacterium]|nr:tetratricopeptide repeat protein [Deltaproteobacteria bacterium]